MSKQRDEYTETKTNKDNISRAKKEINIHKLMSKQRDKYVKTKKNTDKNS